MKKISRILREEGLSKRAGKQLTVGQLIRLLKTQPQDKKVVCFAAGDSYPVLGVQDLADLGSEFGYEEIEISCGWNPIDTE